MNIVKHSFYCYTEVMEFILQQKYSDHKAALLLAQAIRDYNKTGMWYIDYTIWPNYPLNYTFSLILPGLKLTICQN